MFNFGIFGSVHLYEIAKKALGFILVSRMPDILKFAFGRGLKALWQFAQHFGWFCEPSSAVEEVKANRRAGDYQKGDERILGDSDFVKAVLSQAEERMRHKYRLLSEGYDVEKLIDRVAAIFKLAPAQLLSNHRNRSISQARSLFCFWAVDQLAMTQIRLAQMFNQTASAISHAVRRGRTLAEKDGYGIWEE